MAAKTQRQASRKKPNSSATPQRPLGWLIAGFAMGLVVGLLVHLEVTRDEPAPRNGSRVAEETDANQDRPRFEFYRLLSEQEVDVAPTESQALPRSEESASADPAPDTAGRRYLLQAGSFRGADDADALKANLALLSIEADVQVVELPGGETWHRVRIGPFANLDQVNGVRERMAREQIDSILLRAGG